jgi:hypothetical protein
MKQKYIERELWIAPAEDSIKKYKEKKRKKKMREPYLLFRNRLIWTVGSDGVLDGLEDPSYSFVTG